MKNILVPCDFSKPSEEAFKLDVSIASQSKGEVHVLHVFDITYLNGNPTLANSYGFNVDFLKEIERAVEQKNSNHARTVCTADHVSHILRRLIFWGRNH